MSAPHVLDIRATVRCECNPDWLFLLPTTPHTPRPAPIPLGAGRGHQS